MDTPQTIAEEMLAQAERDGCATDWRLRDWADRLAKVQPEGWVLVPREPTDAQMDEAERVVNTLDPDESLWVWLQTAYRAFLYAAPKHEGGSLDSRQGLLGSEGGRKA